MIFKNRYVRVLAVIVATCLGMLLAVWAVAGPLAKPQIVKWFKSQGAHTATIESVIFNPFQPSLQVKALNVNTDKGQPLYLERAYVRLSWWALFRKEIRVRRVEFQSLKMKVDQNAQGVTVGGLKLAAGEPAASPPDKAAQPLDWHLRLDDLVLSSSQVDLSMPNFTAAIALEQVQLQNVLLGVDRILGDLDMQGTFNKAPLHLNTQVDINKGQGAVTGNLNLDHLALKDFQPFIAHAVSQLQGEVALQTQWHLDINGTAMALDQDATVQFADTVVETPDVALGQKKGEVLVDLAVRAKGDQIEMAHIKRLVLKDAHISMAMKKKVPQKSHQAPPRTSSTTAQGAAKASEKQPPAMSIQVDAIQVAGDTRIDFSDHNLDPTFNEQIRNLNLKITALDNKKPETPSPFVLSAEIQKYGKLNFSGTVKPFSQDLFAKVTGHISEYGLPSVSGYTQSMLGYHIRTGQLRADVDLKIENRLLNGQTKFDFQALKLIPSAEGTSEKLTKQATMPLDLALGYISDDKGNLQLNMPINGSLDDPQFGIYHLCQIVMVRAAKSAAYGYLKNIILPYGALVRIGVGAAVKAGQNMMELKLAPLVYQPGQVSIAPESQAYIDQLVALMHKESNMRVIICGVATDADILPAPAAKVNAAEKEKHLMSLAKERTDMFKGLLIETHGIASSRLLDCYPRIDTDPEGAPRIEIDL